MWVFYVLEGMDFIVSGAVDFEVEVLLGVCWFVLDICDDLAIYVFL